jgi:branched-chain amino acid aminotransferase
MPVRDFFIEDGLIREIKDFRPNTGIEIYEVIRVQKGVPLFAEDHMNRFFHSAWLCHLEIPVDETEIRSYLRQLISINGVEEGNIRFSYCFRPKGIFHAYFIPHHYPDPEMILKGVECGLYSAERHDPNAKVVQTALRDAADAMIRGKGYYEILLINRNGEITEGSRSNLFFQVNGALHTAPSEEVLPGITRQKVLELATQGGFDVIMKNLPVRELSSADGVFLTGTSPKILPVRKIEEQMFRVDQPEIRWLMYAFDQLIDTYIKNNRQ